jgi:DNA processing protein
MTSARESAALVALVRLGRRPRQAYAELVEHAGAALPALEQDLAGPEGQVSLIPEDPEPLLVEAAAEIARWHAAGYGLVTVLDDTYPENLRGVHDRPPLIFVAGRMVTGDRRAVAVVGSRRASEDGLAATAELAEHLVHVGYTVISGLAAGIDTVAHIVALAAGGRTLAVIGTGLAHRYPPENAALQQRIGDECAVISQFWPDAAPSRRSFPMRNAVMSGLALATVIVEASATSGARVQARLALAHGRPVFLLPALLEQSWARELSTRPGVHTAGSPEQITSTIERLSRTDALAE